MLEPPTKLRGDLLTVSELGGDPRAILAGSGTGYESVLALEPIEQDRMAALFDRLAGRSPAGFAITCGLAIRAHHLGALGYRLSNCETVGDMIEVWSRYAISIGYPLDAVFERNAADWRMTFTARYPMTARAYEFCVISTIAGFVPSALNLSGHRIALLSIGLPFPSNGHMPHCQAIGAGRLLFDQEVAYITGKSADLDRRIVAADPRVERMCDEICQRLWGATEPRASLINRLQSLVLSGKVIDLRSAGQALGMSDRSVQRRLAEAGTSFHLLLDEARRQRAIAMLADNHPPKVIAFELGLHDVGSLRRSFRRWTGRSCSEWRRGPHA